MTESLGLSPTEPPRIPEPPTSSTVKALRLLGAPPSVLLLLDVSGSMKEQVQGAGGTRMQATVRLAEEGLARLPPGSQAGLWIFSTHLDGERDHRELVAVGALDDERRGKITSALRSLEPGGDTGLTTPCLPPSVRRAATRPTRPP